MSGTGAAAGSERGVFIAVLLAAMVLRASVALLLPFTGDEAYYYFWGVYPDYGGYDHPGMVGWWLAPLVRLGSAPWLIRLPAVLLLPAVAWITFELSRPAGASKAWLAAAAVMLVPAELLNVLTTTDTPLVLFCLASLLAYQRALQRVAADLAAGEPRTVNAWHGLAGLLLGAALFSKYFAGLLAIAYFAHAIAAPRQERPWPGLIVVAIAALPLFLLNMLWNYEHCWLNILFNFYTRHDNLRLSPRDIAVYLVILVYLTSPLLLWQLMRASIGRGRLRSAPAPGNPGDASPAARRIVLFALWVPLAVFGLVSLVKSIGLHWVFAFTPLAFVLGAWDLDLRALRQNLAWLVVLSALHVAALGVIAALPIETWKHSHLYDGIVLTVEPDAVLSTLAPYARDYVFATDGYSNSVTLSYARRRAAAAGGAAASGQASSGAGAGDSAANGDFLVFGAGSAHGRQQDRFDDFRPLDGRDILVFRKTPPPPAEYAPYFDAVDYRSTVLRGVPYYIVLGRGFRYPVYRDRVLAEIRDKFYAAPSWLPRGHCFFCERYFPGEGPSALSR